MTEVAYSAFRVEKSASRHPEASQNYTSYECSTMADYKTYLASSILTEDKVVCYYLRIGIWKSNKPTDHVSSSQPRFEGSCQCREGVGSALPLCGILLMKIRMLYDFHHKQNVRKPGTIHATYLLSGTKRPEDPIPLNGDAKKDGEDDYMQSSPFMSSSMPQPEEGTGESSVLSITLVREEDLEGWNILQYQRPC
jgi:DNA polymerase delta subunit 3